MMKLGLSVHLDFNRKGNILSDMIDQHYMLTDQYKTASKLGARIQLHERFSTNPVNLQHWVFDQIDLPPNARILELGCGPGTLWQKNFARLPHDWTITLSDFSAGMLQEIRCHLPADDQRFSFQIVDAQAIPFDDNTFDAVLANHMLYHVPDLSQALSEIRRVLHPQGKFYATTNGSAHLQEIKLFMQQAGFGASNGVMGYEDGAFRLENGLELLASWFSQIELRRFEGDLAVTEAEPIVAFIIASVKPESINEQNVKILRALVEQELSNNGIVHITKNTGIFIADGP
jgi:ubiquinone/menaquinone biosynthesis C-methylase UbiE